VCYNRGARSERRKREMRKWIKNKEIRDLMFIVVAIFMAMLICVTSIMSGGLFGIIVSIVLLALLCVGLGYLYCKNEDKVLVESDKVEKPKAKVATNLPTIDLSKLGLEKKAESKNAENNS
jgi:hypothetical protein